MKRWQKKLWVLGLLSLWVGQGHSPGETRVQTIERWMTKTIRNLPAKMYRNKLEIQDRWSLGLIKRTAIELERVERLSPFHVLDLFGLIDYESGWRFWKCWDNEVERWSTTRRRKITVIASEDCGLTQQNSKYVRGRFWREFKTKFKHWMQLQPDISVRLMMVRFKECREYWPNKKLTLTCYHGNSTARKEKRFAKQCEKAWAKYKKAVKKGETPRRKPVCENTNYYKAWAEHVARFRGRRAIFELK